MRQIVKLWNDDRGSGLLTGEWLFLFGILLLGLVGGLVSVRQALMSELLETANAIAGLKSSFSFSGQNNSAAGTTGTSASDRTHTIANAGVGASGGPINENPAN